MIAFPAVNSHASAVHKSVAARYNHGGNPHVAVRDNFGVTSSKREETAWIP
jgi:hypothetical protein